MTLPLVQSLPSDDPVWAIVREAPRKLTSWPVRLSPRGYVRAANELIDASSRDPFLRGVAMAICRDCRNIPNEAPLAIANWVRNNIGYAQESGEVIQGPWHTLSLRIGDCDDLVVCWASLVRSLGFPAHLAGLGDGRVFQHAIGELDGTFYELVNDDRWGGPPTEPLLIRLPRPLTAYVWRPRARRGTMHGPPRVNLGPLREQVAALGLEDELDGLTPESVLDAASQLPGVAGDLGRAGASAAGVASSATGIAAALGASSAAVPIIGWAVAGAALMAQGIMALGRFMKNRRRIVDVANGIDAYVETIAKIVTDDENQQATIKTRLLELAPVLAGTLSRGRRGDTVQIATGVNRGPFGETTWLDGSRGRRRGVFAALGDGQTAYQVGTAHAVALRTLAAALAQLPLEQRRDALSLALGAMLGRGAIPGTGLRPHEEVIAQYRRLAPQPSSASRTSASSRRRSSSSTSKLLLPAAAVAAVGLVALAQR